MITELLENNIQKSTLLNLVPLNEVAFSIKGKKPTNLSPQRTQECFMPYVDIKAFEKRGIDNYTDGKRCTLCNENDVLVVWDGARCGLVGKGVKGAIGSTLAKIESNALISNYLFYFLQYHYHTINKNPKGIGIPHIEPSLFWNLLVPLISKEDQKYTTDKIEELFSELDHAEQQLLYASQQLKVYTKSILKYTLVNSTNAPIVSLGNLLFGIEAGKSFKCEERPPQEGEAGIVKVSAVSWGEFNEEESKTVLEKNRINDRYLIHADDFLISRANTIELVGACVIVQSINKKLMLSDKVLRLKINSSILPKYLLYFLRSIDGRLQIEKLSTGNQESMRNIGQERLRQIQIPLPSMELQSSIVNEIEAKLTQVHRMSILIDKEYQRLKLLKQCVLNKAFKGELI